jgi:hypothetical protein
MHRREFVFGSLNPCRENDYKLVGRFGDQSSQPPSARHLIRTEPDRSKSRVVLFEALRSNPLVQTRQPVDLGHCQFRQRRHKHTSTWVLLGYMG